VLATLEKRGYKVTAVIDVSGEFSVVRGDEVNLVTFCKGRLMAYSYSVPSGIRGFIRRVTQLTAQLGPGDFASMSSETSVGELNSLSVTWTTQPDQLSVSYFAPAERSSESVSVMHLDLAHSVCRTQPQ